MVEDAEKIVVVDRQKEWLRELGEWSGRQNVEVVHCAEAGTGLEELRRGKHKCGILNVSFTGYSIFEGMQEARQPLVVISDKPCIEAATRAVECGATAYLHEPVEAGLLIEKVGAALSRSSVHRAMKASVARDGEMQRQVEGLLAAIGAEAGEQNVCGREFVDLSVWNFTQAIWDLREVTLRALGEKGERPVCHLFNCPRLTALAEAVRETIRVLERTKGAFKSQELAALRRKLEALLERERS